MLPNSVSPRSPEDASRGNTDPDANSSVRHVAPEDRGPLLPEQPFYRRLLAAGPWHPVGIGGKPVVIDRPRTSC